THGLLGAHLERIERALRTQERDATAGHDALFHGGTRCMKRIFDPSFLLFHLGFGGGTDLDDGNAADELRQPLLQLLAVVVAGGVVDLRADFSLATLDLVLLAGPIDNGGIILVDLDALGLTQIRARYVREFQTQLLAGRLTTRAAGDGRAHLLAARGGPRARASASGPRCTA